MILCVLLGTLSSRLDMQTFTESMQLTADIYIKQSAGPPESTNAIYDQLHITQFENHTPVGGGVHLRTYG